MSDEYKNLDVWKVGIELTKEVYIACKNFPKEEIYALTAQIKKSAVSVPSNIAEGSGRRSGKEFIRFINIAAGSLCELETQLIIANELGFVQSDSLNGLLSLIRRIDQMLIMLRRSLEKVELKVTMNDKRLTVNE